MSITKSKTSTGETKWIVRLYEDGRGSKKLKRTFDRKNDADAFEQDFKKEVRNREKDPFAGISLRDRVFRDEAEHWFNDGKLRFTLSHQKRVQGVLKEVLPQYGDLTIDKFTPDLLSKIQQQEKARGMANATVNRKTEVLTAILNFSAKQRRTPYNPSVGFRKLKRDGKEMEYLNQAEAVSFLTRMNEVYPKNSEQRWVYVAYLVAMNTAIRAGELWGLKVMDLSPDRSSLWIRRQFNRVNLEFGPTKSKKARFVPCPDELWIELEDLISLQNLKSDDTIFRNEKGNPICHDNFADRQFAKDLKVWGGRRVRFHDLRHTATTLMIANGIDIKTVKEICGHADISTTMNYVHLLSGSIANVSKVFSLKPKANERGTNESELHLIK